MILVDTSAWVEFDRATGSPVERTLTGLIETAGEVAVTDPILMEVLAGARDDAGAGRLRRLLTSFGWIPAEAPTDFEAAARIYRSCRSAGVSPRGMVDCMIAAIAIRSRATVLSADGDFEAMAQVVPLRLEPTVSPGR